MLQKGVNTEQIISLNFESFQVAHLLNAPALYNYIREKITNREKYYLLLDEIQEVQEWEKAINSFTVDFHVDIILTGSNSRLLSSELSTYLAGRYIEIPVYTLSYREYLDFQKKYSIKKRKLNHSSVISATVVFLLSIKAIILLNLHKRSYLIYIPLFYYAIRYSATK